MVFSCPLCHIDILGTLDVPAEVGGLWICCVCHDASVQIEVEHFVENHWDTGTEVGTKFSDDSDDNSALLCTFCGIVLHGNASRVADGFCFDCTVEDNSDSEERAGSSEDDICTSTEAPSDHEDALNEDVAVDSDFERSEILQADDCVIAVEAEFVDPDSHEVVHRVQESQPDLDASEPPLKRSRH
jgi:hypothetical protein